MKRRNPKVDAGLLIQDAAKLLPNPARRLFLRNAASLGALVLLTGCDIVDGPTSERALRKVSEFNDWIQARLFNPSRLAETYRRHEVKGAGEMVKVVEVGTRGEQARLNRGRRIFERQQQRGMTSAK